MVVVLFHTYICLLLLFLEATLLINYYFLCSTHFIIACGFVRIHNGSHLMRNSRRIWSPRFPSHDLLSTFTAILMAKIVSIECKIS